MIRRPKNEILEASQIEVAATAGVVVVSPPAVDYIFPDLAPQFPQELKKLDRWIVRTADKHPYSAFDGDEKLGPIDPHDEQYQADYNTAMGALDQTTMFSGAGFVFNYADGLTGVDFDDCVNPETGEIEPIVLEIIRKVSSYTEYSPSREGVHIFTRGWQFPIGPNGEQGSKIGKAEMYSGKRYFTTTGNHVAGTPTTVNTCDLNWLYERIVKNREFFVAKTKTDGSSQSDSSCVVTIKKPTIISSKYNTLMKGVILRSKDTTGSTDFAIEDDVQILEYESQSSADYALLRLIINRLNTEDVEAVKAEFRTSPLGQRAKADRDDYLEGAIKKLLLTPRQPFVNHVAESDTDVTGLSIDRPKLLTEVGNGRRLIETYGLNTRYCPDDDEWMYWSGKVWLVDRKSVHIHDLMKRVLMGMQTEAGALVSTISPELMAKLNKDLTPRKKSQLSDEESKALEDFKLGDAYLKWAKASESSQKIRGSVEQARSEPGISITKAALDLNTLVCNVENGSFRFDPNTGSTTFGRHSREDLATKMMPVSYDPNATCPQFKKFIEWMFPEKGVQTYIQTYLGLCLTGIVVRRVLVLYGEGANGKSTLMKVLYHMFGEAVDKSGARQASPYSQHVAFSTFSVGREETAGGARADLMPLKGARLISASESNKSSGKNVVKLDMARLKEMTGGDPTKARGLYEKDETQFTNQGKIILQTNNVPSVSDDSDGAWDRIRKVDCNSRIEDKDQDERLAEKLIGESSGILNWLLEGLALYFSNGLVETVSINASTEAYRGVENHMARFVDDDCDLDDGAKTPTSEVYSKYKYWCGVNGETTESQKALTQYLSRRYKLEAKHYREGNLIRGIRLRTVESRADVKM